MTGQLDKEKLATLSKQRHECIEELKSLKQEKLAIETSIASLAKQAVEWLKIRNEKNIETKNLKNARSESAGKSRKELLVQKLENMERDLMVGKISNNKEKGFVNKMKELKREIDNLGPNANKSGGPPSKKQKEIHAKMVAVAKEASNAHKAFSETLDEIVITTLQADGLVVRRKKLTKRFERLQEDLNNMHESVPKHMKSSEETKTSITDYLDGENEEEALDNLMQMLNDGGTFTIGGNW